jgi:hypothetical protein
MREHAAVERVLLHLGRDARPDLISRIMTVPLS